MHRGEELRSQSAEETPSLLRLDGRRYATTARSALHWAAESITDTLAPKVPSYLQMKLPISKSNHFMFNTTCIPPQFK